MDDEYDNVVDVDVDVDCVCGVVDHSAVPPYHIFSVAVDRVVCPLSPTEWLSVSQPDLFLVSIHSSAFPSSSSNDDDDDDDYGNADIADADSNDGGKCTVVLPIPVVGANAKDSTIVGHVMADNANSEGVIIGRNIPSSFRPFCSFRKGRCDDAASVGFRVDVILVLVCLEGCVDRRRVPRTALCSDSREMRNLRVG